MSNAEYFRLYLKATKESAGNRAKFNVLMTKYREEFLKNNHIEDTKHVRSR